ncbi:hypothetical protein OUZ56_013687 [Daphnia magna]|uniref:Uncharacterized protein n=1 Tax=Daphnia magna TaxID=35525 RepID=A0ABQ9Z6N7_9CRUS|nr:hypothetical protein OUZ56_013687 [Daphnia magna]
MVVKSARHKLGRWRMFNQYLRSLYHVDKALYGVDKIQKSPVLSIRGRVGIAVKNYGGKIAEGSK